MNKYDAYDVILSPVITEKASLVAYERPSAWIPRNLRRIVRDTRTAECQRRAALGRADRQER